MGTLASVCLISILIVVVVQLIYSFYIGSFLIKLANELEETRAIVEELRYIQYVRSRRHPGDDGLVDIPSIPAAPTIPPPPSKPRPPPMPI